VSGEDVAPWLDWAFLAVGRTVTDLRRALAQAEHERDEARAEVADCYGWIARARALLDEKRERIAELEGLLAMRGQA
jgi:hypothetical protein